MVAKEYRATIFATQSGRVITGLVKADDTRSITIQTSDALVIVPKNEIDERVQSDQSMMPENQPKQFTDDEIRSLLAYLRVKQQTPMLATHENVATIFNGKT